MDKAKKIFETMCTTNDEAIKNSKLIGNVVVFLKDGEETLHELSINNSNKLRVREEIKQLVRVHKVDAYILIYNAKAYMKHEAGHKEVNDCIIRSYYTKNESILEIVWYKGINILSKERINGREVQDLWDAWWKPVMHIVVDTRSKDKEKDKVDINKFVYKKKNKK